MKRIFILVAVLAFAGCAPDQPKTDPKADKEAIVKLRDSFESAFNANDATEVGSLYSEAAVMLQANQPSIHGRAAVVASNKTFFDQFKAKIALTPVNTSVSGDMAFDEGIYTMTRTLKVAGAKPATE